MSWSTIHGPGFRPELAWAGRISGGPARPRQFRPRQAWPKPDRAGWLDISGPPARARARPGLDIQNIGRARAWCTESSGQARPGPGKARNFYVQYICYATLSEYKVTKG